MQETLERSRPLRWRGKAAALSGPLFFLWVMLHSTTGLLAGEASTASVNMPAQYTYRAGPSDGSETARALALYGAAHTAVEAAAARLRDRHLLKDYGDQEKEIFCLATKEIDVRIVDETSVDATGPYTIKIDARVSPLDFIKAEMRNNVLDKRERHMSWRAEMDPVVSSAVDPATELSRAYRTIRKHHFRIAVIYLDHLEKKYPFWADVYLAKAQAFGKMHRTEKAQAALASACRFGSREACAAIERWEESD